MTRRDSLKALLLLPGLLTIAPAAGVQPRAPRGYWLVPTTANSMKFARVEAKIRALGWNRASVEMWRKANTEECLWIS
jgi:hypothetical protein